MTRELPWENHMRSWCSVMRQRLLQIRLLGQSGVSVIDGRSYRPLRDWSEMEPALSELERLVAKLQQELLGREEPIVGSEAQARFVLRAIVRGTTETLDMELSPKQVAARYGRVPDTAAARLSEVLAQMQQGFREVQYLLDAKEVGS